MNNDIKQFLWLWLKTLTCIVVGVGWILSHFWTNSLGVSWIVAQLLLELSLCAAAIQWDGAL